MSRSFALSLLMLLSGSLSTALPGEDPLLGKRVVVINDKAILEHDGNPVGNVSECSVFTVDRVEEDRLWINSVHAYIGRSDVVPFDDAIHYYNKRLETSKTASNFWNRAQIRRIQGDLDAAIRDANESIRLKPNESVWVLNRGILWGDKKNYDKAIADYTEAIRLDPKNGNAYHNRGAAWETKNEFDKAITDFEQALKYKSSHETTGIFGEFEVIGGDSSTMVNSRALSLNGRGNAWFGKQKYDIALADYEEAIQLDPRFQLPRSNRRRVWERQRKWERMATDMEAQLKERTPTVELWNEFAWLRATCPDDAQRNGKQAIEYATRACELTEWNVANYLDTLAAAYAEAGDFENAVEWMQKGINLAASDQRADFESRLKRYQQQQPYRELPSK